MAELPVRSGPGAIGTAAATQYTAPATAGGYAILRTVHISNSSTLGINVRVSIGALAAGTAIYYDLPIPPNGTLDWSGFLPLAASEIIQTQASAAGLAISLGIVTGP